MITYFKLAIAILIPFLLGVLGLAAILKEKLSFFAYFERMALAFASGVWMLALIMFSLPFINVPLTFQNISLAVVLALIALFPFSLKSLIYFLPKSFPKSGNLWFPILLFPIFLKVLFVFWSALLKPIIGPDLMTYYALAAKHTFIYKVPLHLYNEPPLPFLIESWIPINLGTWNDALLPLFYPFMFICLLVIFFCALRRYYSEFKSLFFTFLLASIPFLLFHAGTLYADFPITFYYSTATIYLFLFLKEFKLSKDKAMSYLWASVILTGIFIWVKKSGIYYAGINFSVLISFLVLNRKLILKNEWKKIGNAVLLTALIALPWLAYEKLVILTGSFWQVLSTLQNLPLAPTALVEYKGWLVMQIMLRNMFLEGNWQMLWLLFLSLSLIYPQRILKTLNLYLAGIILLQIAALFILFSCTDQFPNLLDNSMLNRLMLHFAPVVLYFCAEVCFIPSKSRSSTAG